MSEATAGGESPAVERIVAAASTWRSLQYAPADTSLVFGRHEVILQEYHRELARRAGMPLG